MDLPARDMASHHRDAARLSGADRLRIAVVASFGDGFPESTGMAQVAVALARRSHVVHLIAADAPPASMLSPIGLTMQHAADVSAAAVLADFDARLYCVRAGAWLQPEAANLLFQAPGVLLVRNGDASPVDPNTIASNEFLVPQGFALMLRALDAARTQPDFPPYIAAWASALLLETSHQAIKMRHFCNGPIQVTSLPILREGDAVEIHAFIDLLEAIIYESLDYTFMISTSAIVSKQLNGLLDTCPALTSAVAEVLDDLFLPAHLAPL